MLSCESRTNLENRGNYKQGELMFKNFSIVFATCLILGWILWVPMSADANSGASSDLMTDCTSNDPYKRGFCTGYVAGVDHIFSTLMARKKISKQYCPGQQVTLGELKKVWKKWLAMHPKKLNLPADVTMVLAFKEAFPCASE